ncbi:MAG: ATP-binding protein [Planctomycetota bacterium]
MSTVANPKQKLVRTTFRTSRNLDYFSEKELTSQTGHRPEVWPLVALKELSDNALDACEEAGVAPEITVTVNDEGITVADNGPGMPVDTIKGVLDFDTRVSSREAYAAPDRGAQGNALKTLAAMPYVLDGDVGKVIFQAHGRKHEITLKVDVIRQEPVIEMESGPSDVRNGTIVTVCWPAVCMDTLTSVGAEFLQLVAGYAWLNPHLSISVNWFGETESTDRASDPGWQKWRPSDPTCAHWYPHDRFERLISGYIAHDQDRGDDRFVREFVGEFRGLSGSAKQKKVLDASGLARTKLSALVNCNGLRHEATKALLEAMQAESKPVKPAALGVIGQHHIKERFDDLGADLETFQYRKVELTDVKDHLPAVVEVAFAELSDCAADRWMTTGINWSPSLENPFTGLDAGCLYSSTLDDLLVDQYADSDEPVAVFVHVACPIVDFKDRGKSSIDVHGKLGDAIKAAVLKVTDARKKERKREEAEDNRRERRQQKSAKSTNGFSVKDAIFRVLPEAIDHASGGSRIVFPTRNLFYSTRELIQRFTDKELGWNWFQVVVDEWQKEHGDIPLMYRDPRGYLVEPHSGKEIPLGTRAVDKYSFPLHLYDKLFFVEKKGLHPTFQAFRLAEKYDMAIVCAEGYAPRAAKTLLAAAQTDRKMTICCLHDADPHGYNIARTLRKATATFSGRIDVIDLGLQLQEALDLGLRPETFTRKKAIPKKLRLNEVETEHFRGERIGNKRWKAQRVELNALAADPDRFIAWVEGKLEEHGLARKLIPPAKAIKEHVAEQREAELRQRVHDCFVDVLRLNTMEARVVDRMRRRVSLGGVPEAVKTWGQKLQHGRWCNEVDRVVDRRVDDVDDEIHEAVEDAISEMEGDGQ